MKITVAGAGHGGLAAGALLSKNGHDVTVYEKNDRDSLGHDWEDRFTFSLLSDITGEEIPDDSWRYRGDCAFVSPSYRTRVVINYTDENRQKIMQRKTVMKMLLDFAEKCGVRFRFNTEVLSAVTENGAVTGIRTADGEILSDLVIDAAGVFSPGGLIIIKSATPCLIFLLRSFSATTASRASPGAVSTGIRLTS